MHRSSGLAKSCHSFYDHKACSKHQVVMINRRSDCCSEQGAHWVWRAGAGIGCEMRLGRHSVPQSLEGQSQYLRTVGVMEGTRSLSHMVPFFISSAVVK